MPVNRPKFWGAFSMWWLVVLLLLPLLVGACASSQKFTSPAQPQEQEGVLMASTSDSTTPAAAQPDPLQLCTQVSEEKLQTMRGCYNEFYYFAYTFNITAGADPQVNVSFSATVPDSTVNAVNSQPNQVSFNNGQVQYLAGVGGDPAGGNGFYQLVNVAGSDTMVIANTQVNIIVPNATSLIPSINIFSTPTLTGVK